MNPDDIFGDPIKAPGPAGINTGSVPETVARLFSFGVNMVFAVAGITLLILLLWGSLDWIMSGGDETKLEKARGKIAQAITGIIIMVVVLVIWAFISTYVIGTVKYEDGTIRFNLPSINQGEGGADPGGGGANPGGGGANPGGGGANPGGGKPGGGIFPGEN